MKAPYTIQDLAKEIVDVLEKKACKGCDNPSWADFENGMGENVGKRIDRLIKKAKRIIEK